VRHRSKEISFPVSPAYTGRLRAPAVAVLALVAALPVWAQTAPAEAQRVEIIGVTPLPGLGVPKDQVPANVQTARGAEIERSNAIDLSSFMNRKLGSVHINDIQNNPFQPDVNFRGFTASPLLGTPQGLSVYVDGVRLNQPFGDVVSWDLIPKSAISGIALMPGSNPLFGLNTLGGALSVQTKDGLKNPGTSVQVLAGANRRVATEFEHGGSTAGGLNWFVTGNRFHEKGWRQSSPSDVTQLFGKLGVKTPGGSVSLSAALADNSLNGNGLQDFRLLDKDNASVYSKPDNTKNKAYSLNLAATQALGAGLSFSGNAYARRIKTRTTNGDLNEGSLDQATYLATTSAADRAALTAAGYTGLPTVTETAANTPFPKWRCIAQALLKDEPGEKCNGVINTTATTQTNVGFSGQVTGDAPLAGMRNLWTVGAAYDTSRVQFNQASELGYLNPDRSVTGVGAFGDGVTGGDVDGAPYDTRVDLAARTTTVSVYGSDTLALNPRTHLTASGRYNRTVVKNRAAITPGGGAGSLDGDHTFSRLNPALGLTFAASPTFTAYAGLNQGSRAPSAIELGCADPENPCRLPNSMAGDPPLKQVVTTTLEAGVRGSTAGVSWNLGVFRADNKDDILFVADQQSGFGYFRNFGKTRRQGLETGVSTQVGPVNLSANYTWLDATYQSAESVNGTGNSSNDSVLAGFPGVDGNISIQPGNRIPLIPQHTLKLSAEAALAANFSVSADVTAVGSAYARGNENNQHQADGRYYLGAGRTAPYEVLNLGAEWKPMAGLKLFVQVNNALDRRYNTAAQLGSTGLDANGNFVARPFAANANGNRPLVHSTFFAPGAPRSLWLGLRYDFGQ